MGEGVEGGSMGEKRISQVVWLSSLTFQNIIKLYNESGAYRIMAINNFIAKILDFVTKDDETIEKILRNILDTYPEIHDFSKFVKIVTETGEEKARIWRCPLCSFTANMNDWHWVDDARRHLTNYHQAKEQSK